MLCIFNKIQYKSFFIYYIYPVNPNPSTMKRLLINLVVLCAALGLSAQNFNYSYFENEDKAEITIFHENGFTTHHFNDPDRIIEVPFTDEWGNGHSMMFNRSILVNDNENHDRASMSVYEPGIMPEGDLPRKMSYTPDGSMLAVMNEHSDNVCYYDADTWELLADVSVGNKPMDMAITEDYTYVCCYKSNNVYVVDHDDFSIDDRIPVYDKPVHIEVNSNETRIYVSFYSYQNGSLAAYDMENHNELYRTEEPLINRTTYIGNAGRRYIPYPDFLLTKNDAYIVTQQTNTYDCILLNSETGQLVDALPGGGLRGFCSSVSGDTLFLTFGDQYRKYISRYDLNQLNVIDSIVIPGMCNKPMPVVANSEGSEAVFLDASGGKLYMANFDEMSYSLLSNSAYLLSLECSGDYRFAFGPAGFGVCIIDMNSGDLTVNTGGQAFVLHGAIHPEEYECVGANFDPNFNEMSLDHDNFFTYHFDNTGAITMDSSIVSGYLPEADMCFETAFNQDRSKLFVTNILSGNISVIDMGTGELDSLLPIAFYENIARMPGSDMAVLAGSLSDNIALFSMSDYSIIDTLRRSACTRILFDPEGQYAYLHRANNHLLRVAVSDSSLELIDSVELVYSGGAFSIGIKTNNFISPDGQYILASDNEDHQQGYLNIVATDEFELVKTLPISSGRLWDAAFTPDGKRACLGLAEETTEIIYLDGVQSYVEHHLDLELPVMWIKYYDGMFYLLGESYVHEVDPEYGGSTVAHSHPLTDSRGLAIDNKGEFVILGQDKVYYEDLVFPLPGDGRIMQFEAETQQCILPLLGPDYVCVIDLLSTEIEYLPKTPGKHVKVFPNPAGPAVYIESDWHIERIEIFDSKGRCTFDKAYNNRQIRINTEAFDKGTYIIRISSGNVVSTEKMILR